MRKEALPILAVCLLVATGCETAKISHATGVLPGPQALKTVPIFVKEFDASRAVFKGENSQVSVLANEDRQRISRIISAAIIERLTMNGFDARPLSGSPSPDAIIVEGTVSSVDKGSFSKRMLIGVGAGSASIKANVQMYRADNPANSIADLEMAGTSKAFTGGRYANNDFMGIYSASLGYKAADYIMGKAKAKKPKNHSGTTP